MKEIGLAWCLSTLACAGIVCAQNGHPAEPAPRRATNTANVIRGRYLVEEVSKCADCHTPNGPDGEPDRNAWLKGATLGFAPTAPIPGWVGKTPDITSSGPVWSRWGEAGLVKFFETGRTPNGGRPAPPMPSYTLRHTDAVAIAAYLKSLK